MDKGIFAPVIHINQCIDDNIMAFELVWVHNTYSISFIQVSSSLKSIVDCLLIAYFSGRKISRLYLRFGKLVPRNLAKRWQVPVLSY